MPTKKHPELTEEQVLYFRACRGHLTGEGAPTPELAAYDNLGLQAQQEAPALWALSIRTQGRPSSTSLKTLLTEPPRTLVRTWGQRDTLHLYDANKDWHNIVSARPQWAPGGRRGALPTENELNAARALVQSSQDGIVTRKDLFHITPQHMIDDMATRVGEGKLALQGAAGRFIWRLSQDGELSHAHKIGAEQAYASRTSWFPSLTWNNTPPLEAATALTRRYLSLHGPATPKDIGHFFGARQREVKLWLQQLDKDELVPISCENKKGLLALKKDLPDLQRTPPSEPNSWPLQLLPLWDTLLMAHADKTWTTPNPSEHKLIWRKAAFVAAVALYRGRFVATWSHEKQGDTLHLTLSPLSSWQPQLEEDVHNETQQLAAHLGLKNTHVTFENQKTT